MAKRARYSKVIWFNGIVAGLVRLESQFNLLQPYVPGNVYAYAVLLLTVGNTILRFYTTQPIGGGGK